MHKSTSPTDNSAKSSVNVNGLHQGAGVRDTQSRTKHRSEDQRSLSSRSLWADANQLFDWSCSLPSSPTFSSSSASSHTASSSESSSEETAYSTISSVSSYAPEERSTNREGLEGSGFKESTAEMEIATPVMMDVDPESENTPHSTPMPTPVPQAPGMVSSSSSKTDAFFSSSFSIAEPSLSACPSQPIEQNDAQKRAHTITFPVRARRHRRSMSLSPPLDSAWDGSYRSAEGSYESRNTPSILLNEDNGAEVLSPSPINTTSESPDSLLPSHSLSRNPSTSSTGSGRSRTEDFFASYSFTAPSSPSPAKQTDLSRHASTSSQPGSRTQDFFASSSSSSSYLSLDKVMPASAPPTSKTFPPLSRFFPSRSARTFSPRQSRTMDVNAINPVSSFEGRGFVDLDTENLGLRGFGMHDNDEEATPVSPTRASQGHGSEEDDDDDEDSSSIRADDGVEIDVDDLDEEGDDDIDFLPNIPTRANSLKKAYLQKQQQNLLQQYPPVPSLSSQSQSQGHASSLKQNAPHQLHHHPLPPVPPPLRSLPSTTVASALVASEMQGGKQRMMNAPRLASSLSISTSASVNDGGDDAEEDGDERGGVVEPGLVLEISKATGSDGVTISGEAPRLEFVRMIGQGAFSSVWLANAVPEGIFEHSRASLKGKGVLQCTDGILDFEDEDVDGTRPYLSSAGDGGSLADDIFFDYYADEGLNTSGIDSDLSDRRGSDSERSLVAVKMIPKAVCAKNDGTKISVVREVEVLRRISHPNIASYLSSFVSSSASIPAHYCLILPYVRGGELLDLVNSDAKHSRLTEPVLRRIAGELIGAVGWLHLVGVVHRDIKLENIILTEDIFNLTPNPSSYLSFIAQASSTSPLIKLTDFGLSRFIDTSNPWLTTRCGSEAYAAPELVVGHTSHGHHHSDHTSRREGYDGRQTDAWACGVVLYALATRSLPFDPPLHSLSSVASSLSSSSHTHANEASIVRTDGASPINYGTHNGTASAMKQRREMLMRIALCQWSWPEESSSSLGSSSDVAAAYSSDSSSTSLTTPALKHLISRLLVRSPTQRASLTELWDEPWLIHGGGAARVPGYVLRARERRR